MRAATHHRFGPPDVLTVVDMDSPRPRPGEVVVRAAAAAVNPKDVLVRKGRYRWLGARPPMGAGFDVAGVVDAVGAGVSGHAPGDRVFGMIDGFRGRTCAEHVRLRADQCAPAPRGISAIEAASLPLAASTALQALRDLARVGAGARVLLHGASGGVGVHAIQIAKALGAHVTTTSSASSRARCAALGADVALTYDDPAAPFADGARYDAIVDVYGNRGFGWARGGLRRPGVFVSTVPSRALAVAIARTAVSARRARLVVVRARRRDLEALAAMVEAGALRPVVDRVLPLASIGEAHAYVETRHARGKVVLTIDDEVGW